MKRRIEIPEEYPIAESTHRTYGKSLKGFDKWLHGRATTDETVAEYLVYLFEKGASTSYAKNVVTAIRWRAISENNPDPTGRRTRFALRDYKRKGRGRGNGQVDGLRWEQNANFLSTPAAQYE